MYYSGTCWRGDSGAALVDRYGRYVALHQAGSNTGVEVPDTPTDAQKIDWLFEATKALVGSTSQLSRLATPIFERVPCIVVSKVSQRASTVGKYSGLLKTVVEGITLIGLAV